MCQCLEGKSIDYENLRTPEQKEAMKAIWDILEKKGGAKATPFAGQLNAPYDPGQIAAMNIMLGSQGMGGYKPFGFPLGGLPQKEPDITLNPIEPINPITGGGTFTFPKNWFQYDPYKPKG